MYRRTPTAIRIFFSLRDDLPFSNRPNSKNIRLTLLNAFNNAFNIAFNIPYISRILSLNLLLELPTFPRYTRYTTDGTHTYLELFKTRRQCETRCVNSQRVKRVLKTGDPVLGVSRMILNDCHRTTISRVRRDACRSLTTKILKFP